VADLVSPVATTVPIATTTMTSPHAQAIDKPDASLPAVNAPALPQSRNARN
jgi:hypothetical protein